MPPPRPLPKALLKKMFLKVLHEHHRLGGRYSRSGPEYHAWSFSGILRETIAAFFQIPRLSEDEYTEGLRAVYELERDGYIMQDPSQPSSELKILTEKGRRGWSNNRLKQCGSLPLISTN